jgi:hypothetical protein
VDELKNNLREKLASYIFYYNLTKVMDDKKMIETAKYVQNKNNDYTQAMKSYSFISTFTEEFGKFFQKKSTNEEINTLVKSYRSGTSADLANRAIYYRVHLLNDQSAVFAHVDDIVNDVKSKNMGSWKNVYTGILIPMNPTTTTTDTNKRMYTIYLSMNFFDQELNNDTAYQFKCFLLNNELGRRLDRLMSSSKSKSNILFVSEVKHVPKMGNKNLNEAAEEKKKLDAAEEKKKADDEKKKAADDKKKADDEKKKAEDDKKKAASKPTLGGYTRRFRRSYIRRKQRRTRRSRN